MGSSITRTEQFGVYNDSEIEMMYEHWSNLSIKLSDLLYEELMNLNNIFDDEWMICGIGNHEGLRQYNKMVEKKHSIIMTTFDENKIASENLKKLSDEMVRRRSF